MSRLALLLCPLVLGAGLVSSEALREGAGVVLPLEKRGAPLPQRLSAAQTASLNALLSRAPARAARVGVLVADAESGTALYARQPDAAFTPASNMKLLSMAALLEALGPDYWYSTTVTRPLNLPPPLPKTSVQKTPGKRGEAAASTLPVSTPEHLTLVGLGDPSLEPSSGEHSLARLARQVYARGIRRVGDLWLDARLIGASPGHLQGGQSIPGWTLPLVEKAVTGLSLNDPSVGEGLQTTARPDAAAALLGVGEQFRAALRQAGVQVTGGVKLAPLSAGPEEGVATTRSAPLAQLVHAALKRSDNVWAEQLYARLGVQTQTPVWRPASLDVARERMRALLGRAGVSGTALTALRLQDGSGLSAQDRLTPAVLVRLLRYLYLRPLTASGSSVAPQTAYQRRQNLLIEALPRAGTGTATPAARELGGTLATRMAGLDVRAKTGTLPGVSALSGYLRTRSGRVLAFSVLMDGYAGPASELRRVQDELLRRLAQDD
ncbi:D-alanyl-D-alanine carboxypeptidase/D-alanyl-D-alanine-endopeptidase [Deinococcus sp.]|uniref:D-alanyl-D-alanine carboxypeptidase/D-alanyl-D-alanine-endopeptidase n=1 Tax=Deinococcus sp. TaxID=47478 RepID=UPI003CC5BE4E